MVISKSARSQTKEKWIAGAYIFSGRPDPIWSVSRETVQELEKVWESLENAETAEILSTSSWLSRMLRKR